MTLSPSVSPHRRWLFALFIIAATFIAYYPAWHGSFLFLDDTLVPHSPSDLRYYTLSGLEKIWFHPTRQYYPLTRTVGWAGYHIWGFNPTGFHLLNILLHSLNAIFLWAILRQLKVPGAWLAGAIFALHPVNVESAAWITECRNTLSCFFYLCAILAALKFWLPGETDGPDPSRVARFGDWKFFWLAYVLFLFAMFSKTTTIPLPAVILLLVWWKRGKIIRGDVYPLLLFLATAVGMGLITHYCERHLGARGRDFQISLVDRCLIASRDFWFYLEKLFWPHPLIFIYPRWKIAPSPLLAWLSLLAFVPVAIILWLARHVWGRPVFVALAYFGGLLFLMLGFFNIYYFLYSFVEDHFQYLACMGPLALACACVAIVFRRLGKAQLILAPLLAIALFVLLGTLTWRQCRMYANDDILWRTTLAQNSNAFVAHYILGCDYMNDRRLDDAVAEFKEALKIKPDYSLANINLGYALIQQGRLDDAIAQFQIALQYDPDNLVAYSNLGRGLLSEGRFGEAAAQFQAALKIQPNNMGFQSALAQSIWMLTRSPQVNADEVLSMAENANQMTDGNNPMMLRALAAAYAKSGNFAEAAETGKRALALATKNQPPVFINMLETEILLYQASQHPMLNQTNRVDNGGGH